MKLHDLRPRHILEGRNWRVVPDQAYTRDIYLGDLEIEHAPTFTADDRIVYPGLYVTLEHARPPSHMLVELLRPRRRLGAPPADPADLPPETVARITPIVLVRYLEDGDSEYAEYDRGHWRRIGVEPNPDAPPGVEFIADPLQIDPAFDADDGDFRTHHRRAFAAWSEAYLRQTRG